MYNNKAAWTDLTIDLGDSREVDVHKCILSQANGYFEDLCDRVKMRSVSDSSDTSVPKCTRLTGNFVCQDRGAVKSFSVKCLGPESAAAVVTFVRAIYGFPLPSANDLL